MQAINGTLDQEFETLIKDSESTLIRTFQGLLDGTKNPCLESRLEK